MHSNTRDINLILKSKIDKISEEEMKNEMMKIEAKLSNLKIRKVLDSGYEANLLDLTKNYNAIVDRTIKPIGLNKTDEDTAKKIVLNSILSSFTVGLTKMMVSLFLFMVEFKVYESIKSNPMAFNALYNRLPESTVFEEDNVIINNKQINHEAIPPTLAIIDIFQTLDKNEVIDFYRFISKTPFLCLEHPIGRFIYEQFKTCEMKTFKRRITKVLYRGRIREDDIKPYTEDEMFAPPYGFPGHGRANIPGISALYFTDKINATVDEVNWCEKDATLDVIQVKISKVLKMLDLTDRSCPLLDYCYIPYGKPNDFSAYVVPNFLADCCKSIGIDGMIYKSVKDTKATSYVFFQPDRSWFKNTEFKAWKGDWEN